MQIVQQKEMPSPFKIDIRAQRELPQKLTPTSVSQRNYLSYEKWNFKIISWQILLTTVVISKGSNGKQTKQSVDR